MIAGHASTGRILVTNAARSSAVAVIRSLGRAGWHVIAADSDPGAPGLRSRHAAERALYPPPSSAAAAFADFIERLVQQRAVDLVIPATDEVVHILAGARERIERGGRCRLAIAGPDALAVVMDKSATLRLAERLGVPVPRTRLVRSVEEAWDAASGMGWPVVLKSAVTPCVDENGRVARRPVRYARDRDDLARRFAEFRGGAVLVQEFCAGAGCGVEMLADRGRPVTAFQHRRLAEVPISGGASAWRESVPLDPVLLGHATRLVESLAWTGLIMVEFKVGRDVRLMEMNGRVWGSLPLAVSCGVDFPALLADLLVPGRTRGGAALPVAGYRAGVQAYNLELMSVWLATVLAGRRRYPFLPHPKRREALRAMTGMLGARRCFDMLCRDDPRPGFSELGRIPRKLVSKLAEAIGVRRKEDGEPCSPS